ncbi:hypothetical protein BsWGS_17449 [Bradybaena similaris]
MASDNFAEIHLQQMRSDVWRLFCRITHRPPNTNPVRMSIFEDTPNNTLVAVNFNQCPKLEDSAQAKHIYLSPCVENEKNVSLDILLVNYNPDANKQFGCNYTQIQNGIDILHSVTFANVITIGNTSHGITNGTNFSYISEKYIRPEESTISTVKSEDTAVDSHGHVDRTILIFTVFSGFFVLLQSITVFIIYFRYRRVSLKQSIHQPHKRKLEVDECLYLDVDLRREEESGNHGSLNHNTSQREEMPDDYPYATINKPSGQQTIGDIIVNTC